MAQKRSCVKFCDSRAIEVDRSFDEMGEPEVPDPHGPPAHARLRLGPLAAAVASGLFNQLGKRASEVTALELFAYCVLDLGNASASATGEWHAKSQAISPATVVHRLVDFYDALHTAEPASGHDTIAQNWRDRQQAWNRAGASEK